MLAPRITRLGSRGLTSLLGSMPAGEPGELVRARTHPMRLTARRSALIVSRVRLLAALIAVFTVIWGVADFRALPAEQRIETAAAQALAAVACAAIVALVQGMHTLRHAYRALAFLLAVLGVFFLYSDLHSAHPAEALAGLPTGAGYLPLLMLAGVAIFPLTLVECAAVVALVLGLQSVAWLAAPQAFDWTAAAPLLGALALVGAASTTAALTQLAHLAALVREGLHDSLTGCYARRAGEELLEAQFTWSSRSDAALSVALVAPDRLQELNERFGYAAGDAALRDIALRLHDSMRSGDLLVRWAGDQYLMVMPLATAEQAAGAVQRLLAGGLGMRPDGTPMTASIGVADRAGDEATDWWMLVDTAMGRARAARERGGNRTLAR